MSDELERMLEEGPRTAPEPRSVDATTGRLVVREPEAPASRRRMPVGKLIFPIMIAGVFVLQFVPAGWAVYLFIPIAVLGISASLVEQLRRNRGESEE